MTILLFSLLTAFSSPVFATASYRCFTEFGETVPLSKRVLKKGAVCRNCEDPQTHIPDEDLDSELSRQWNSHVATDPSLKTQIRRKVFVHAGRTYLLDTRYAVKPGPSFDFTLTCHPGQKCEGRIGGANPAQPLLFKTSLFDQRISGSQGSVQIQLGNREHLGWIVRIFKDAVPLPNGDSIAVSGSGELKFFREDPLFLHDVGVDEQLHLAPGLQTRIAAFELKVRCEK